MKIVGCDLHAGQQSIAAVTGRGVFYWLSIGSILLVLSLSANTAFADFPRLARAIAQKRDHSDHRDDWKGYLFDHPYGPFFEQGQGH